MEKILIHPKIQELKRRAAPINYSNVAVNASGQITREFGSDFEKRILAGYAFVWDVPNMHREIMIKGSCAKSIRERGVSSDAKYKITMFWMHDQHDPLGQFEVLEEDDYGLYFRTKPLDNVPNADRALLQIRSGTINQFSGGWDYVWDKTEYDEKRDLIILKEINLFDISPVGIGSQLETFAFRSMEDLTYLHDETESFISSLPRGSQFEARQLFARHKSLIDLEPLEQRMKTLADEKPTKNEQSIDYNYLIKNLT